MFASSATSGNWRRAAILFGPVQTKLRRKILSNLSYGMASPSLNGRKRAVITAGPGAPGADFAPGCFDFLFGSLRSVHPRRVSLSHQTTKFPPTPSISSTSPRLIRMISTQVLYLDSNQLVCYHSLCFARKPTHHAPSKASPPQISQLAAHRSPLLP